MTDVNVQKLAQLARIAIPENDIKGLEKDIPAILAFVEQIKEAGGTVTKETGDHYNIMREDTDPHEGGVYTQDMIDAMPRSKDGYLQVRKIISQD